MTTRAIAFDLDDTLLRDDRTISDYTVSVLAACAARGIRIIPASGRARDSMLGYVRRIGCADCFLSCNGAEVWDARGALMMQRLLEVSLARECARFAQDRDCYVQCYYGPRFYYSRKCAYADAYAHSSLLKGEYAGDLTEFIKTPTVKLLLMDSPERIKALFEEALELFGGRAAVTCSKPYFMEINPLNATKGSALAYAGERFGFDLSEAVAFGDSLNDLTMLSAAGLGVAMGNAWDDVKERCGAVCGTNEQDGVAHYIEDHLLREENL